MRSGLLFFLAVVVLVITGTPSAVAYAVGSPVPAIPSSPILHVAAESTYPVEPIKFALETRIGLFAAGDPINAFDPDGRFGKQISEVLNSGSRYATPSYRTIGNSFSSVSAGYQPMSERQQISQVLNFLPVVGQFKAAAEAISGYDMAAGRYMSQGEQITAAAGFVAGGVAAVAGYSAAVRAPQAIRSITNTATLARGTSIPATTAGVESRAIVPYSGQETPTSWPGNAGFLGDISTTELQVGTVIDRYGLRSGTYVSPQGTPFASRGLPGDLAVKFQPEAYELLQPLKVNTGLVAPGFGYPGLGTQHQLPLSVQELIDVGVLKAR